MKIAVLIRELVGNLARKPVTVEYGRKTGPSPSQGYRGLHVVDLSKCIGCSLCAVECPANAIEMVPGSGEGPRRHPVIHYYRCVFCYHCVAICPKNAYMTSNKVPPPTGIKEELLGKP